MEEGYNENYTEEEIQNVREEIENMLQENGITSVVDTLVDYVDFKAMDDYFADKSEELKNKYKEISDRLKRIGEVFQTDEYLHDRIAEIVEDIQYDKHDINSRERTVETLISAVEILSIYSNSNVDFSPLYDITSQKFNDLIFKDFALIYSNSDIGLILSNEKFASTIADKIKKMSKPEFIYFLLTTGDETYNCSKQISDAKKEQVERFDDDLITEVYNYSGQYSKIPRLYNSMYVDKLNLVFDKNTDAKSQKEIFDSFNDFEFLRYLTKFETSIDDIPQYILESKEFENKMKGLSRENLVYVADLFYEEFKNCFDKKMKLEDYSLALSKIYKEVLERRFRVEHTEKDKDGRVSYRISYQKLVDGKTGHIKYSAKEMRRAHEQLELYQTINNDTNELPYKFIVFSIYGNNSEQIDEVYEEVEEEIEETMEDSGEIGNIEDAEDIEDVDELDNIPDSDEEKLLQDFIDSDELLQEYISGYYVIDRLNNLSDKDIMPYLIRYNLRSTTEQAVRDESEIDEYILNYCKKRILSMPENLTAFSPLNTDGCLTDVISMKKRQINKYISPNNDERDCK